MRTIKILSKILASLLLLYIAVVNANAQSNYKIEFVSRPVFDDTSKVAIQFNIEDNEGKRLKYENVSSVVTTNTVLGEFKRKLKNPRYVQNSFKKIDEPGSSSGTRSFNDGTLNSDDITVSVLVDRSGSMTQSKIDKVNEVIEELLSKMPEGSVYLSSFNNDITNSLPITLAEFQNDPVTVPENPGSAHTALNNAVYTKLSEFDSLAVIPNLDPKLEPLYSPTPLYKRNTPQNFLIVLSDGQDESEKIPKYSNPSFQRIDNETLFNKIKEYSSGDNPLVEIWMIGIKDEDDHFYNEPFMMRVCMENNKPGNYRIGGEEELPNLFVEVINDVLPDYSMEIEFQKGTKFSGLKRNIKVLMTFPDGNRATGNFNFVKGSKTKVFIVDPPSIYEVLLKGLALGLFILLGIILLIQIIVPLFRSVLFKFTYVKSYIPDSDTEKQSCTWCKEEIKPGEKAVFVCEHISHWECWKTNGHKCPNHPDMCEHGKQDYFDINDPLARNETDSIVKQNKKRFTRWIVSGIFAGILTWLVYHGLLHLNLFDGVVKAILPKGVENDYNYIEKYSSLMLLGTILGFFLSLFFLYIEEFRRLNVMIALRLFLRSVIGAVFSFLVFLLGSWLLINLGIYETAWLDIIPWILFGPLLGFYLSIKTTLSASHGILGGFISILISFIAFYVLFDSFNEEYTLVVSFIIYGLGLGASISTIRQMAEKYFLVLKNAPVKNKEFPLHKWISKSADYGMFTIGKGNKSIIKMDWEKGKNVSEDVHAAIYLEKSNKDYPVIVIRDTQNKTYLNDHMLMRPEKEYLLHNGDTFKIGETIFKYEERQKN